MDHFSPVVPAAIRVLVLPVNVSPARFTRLLERLQREASVVRLLDLNHELHGDAEFLSPKTFPQGRLLYQFTSSVTSQQSLQISPYELYREPLLVLGIIDRGHAEAEGTNVEHATQYLRERHPRVVHRQLMNLDDGDDKDAGVSNAISVHHVDDDNNRSVWTAMCQVSSRFLTELSTYAKAMQASPTIQTPGQIARSLQLANSLRESEKRPGSGHATPPPGTAMSSPVDEESPRPSTGSRGLPATSFDQIPGASSQPGIGRSNSGASNHGGKGRSRARAGSHDRINIQGFGPGTSQEKTRARGKARVGIVLGSIFMMAGQWSEALRVLVEHTTRAKSLSDNIWHAKGLDNILVCLLLHVWSGVEFIVPSLCFPSAERSGSGHITRLSATILADDIPKDNPQERKQQQISRLSNAIPEMTKAMLTLYSSHEGSIELSPLVVGEVTVRLSRLLIILARTNGLLSQDHLKQVVTPHVTKGSDKDVSPRPPLLGTVKPLSKTAISDMLAQALPTNDDGLETADHITLLAGIASSYSLLGLTRKKVVILKELLLRLTAALIQARKLGAAEMGIHPAASLSMETGADTILSIVQESRGINEMIDNIARLYGVVLLPESSAESPIFLDKDWSGGIRLKHDVLKGLVEFCEASPDPYAVLRLSASLMRTCGPNAAIDSQPDASTAVFSREEQLHLTTLISRTVAVSKHLGISDAQALYWDPFLVRGLTFIPPNNDKAIIDRSRLEAADASMTHGIPGNPLLYDPNASRPGTAIESKSVLVLREESECVVTLQNPFEVSVDVESIELVTKGVGLSCRHGHITIGPLRFQRILLTVMPESAGETKVISVRVKVHGCRAQNFPIVSGPWSPKVPLTLKDLRLTAETYTDDVDPMQSLKEMGIESTTVSATIVGALPSLILDEFSRLDSGLMLLEGEKQSVQIILRNIGNTTACLFETKDTEGVLRLLEYTGSDADSSRPSEISVKPDQPLALDFEILGKAGVSNTQVNFYYCPEGSSAAKLARMISVPIAMTVNPALQAQHFEVIENNTDIGGIWVAFDVSNAWMSTIAYRCSTSTPGKTTVSSQLEGHLAPGELRRLVLRLQRSNTEIEQSAETIWTQLLDQLHLSWSVGGRNGTVAVHDIPPPPTFLENLPNCPVQLSIEMQPTLDTSKPSNNSNHPGTTTKVGAFVGVRVRLSNRSKRSGPFYVQLAPENSDFVRSERRLAVAGTLQRIVPSLDSSAETTVDFMLCPLLPGALQLNASVRTARIGPAHDERSTWSCQKSITLYVTA